LFGLYRVLACWVTAFCNKLDKQEFHNAGLFKWLVKYKQHLFYGLRLLPQKLPQSLHFLNKNPYLCAAKKSLTTYGFEGNAALNLAVYESLTHHITPSAQAGFYGEFAA
jgi:hypothetical protein